jgi:hypothetical protein
MFCAAAVGLAAAMSSLSAHRQDECLQAALIDVGEQQVRVFLSITPGTEVATRFRAVVDTDADGILSGAETAAYATNAVSQLVLRTDDGERRLELRTFRFPGWDAIRSGTGTIQIEAEAKVPAWTDGAHGLRFENRHLTNLSVYVVAALQPEGGRIAIGRQHRNENQSAVDIRLTKGEVR